MNRTEFLCKQYLKKKQRNPRYSLRSLARQLDLNSGRLSEYLAGKRTITRTMAERMADGIGLSIRDRKRFLDAGYKENQKKAFVPLRQDEFFAISDPTHFYLLSLLETNKLEHSIDWIAKRLGISSIEARDCMDRLKRLGLVAMEKGEFKVINGHLTTTHDVPSASLRKSHRKSIQQAMEALEQVPVHLRDITSITMPIDVARLEDAKKLTKKFRREMAELLERGNKTEVYNLNIQLVPVTRVGSKK